jgi:membrane fusion protein, multidrug efflux system
MTSRFLVIGLFAITVLAACQPSDVSPQQQLDKLRAERSKIDEQIRSLEKLVGENSNSGGSTPVTVHTALSATFDHTIDVKGSIDSRSTVDVTAKMAGQIVTLNVRNGQSVSKGQLLMEIDNEMIKRGMEEVRTQLDFAKTLYEKQKRIFDQKAGSEIQYLQAKNNKEALERRMESLDEQLALSRITAPTSGYVDNLAHSVGEMAMPGMPIFTIVNTSDMRVMVDLAETYVSTVNAGDKVTIIFSDLRDTVRTTISTVARTVNPTSRTFRVEIPLSKVPPMLRPNTTCEVHITDETIPATISVPLESIAREGTKKFVYVVGDKNAVQKREIQTGLISGGKAQVTSGLNNNERVVVRGALDLVDGQRVRIVE